MLGHLSDTFTICYYRTSNLRLWREIKLKSRRARASLYILKLNGEFFERKPDFGRVFGANQKAVGRDSGVDQLLGNAEFFL